MFFSTATRTGGGGCLRSLIILSVLLAGLLVVLYFALPDRFIRRMVDSVTLGRRAAVESVIPVVDGDGAVDGIIVTNRYLGSDDGCSSAPATYYVTWLDPDFRIRWDVDTGLDEVPDRILHDGRNVYVFVGDSVRAIDRSSGEQVWEAMLSDELRKNCYACVHLTTDRLLVMPEDRTLQAFDVANGQVAWQQRLNSDRGGLDGDAAMAVFGDVVAVMDEKEAGEGAELRVLAVGDGSVVRSLSPSCGERGELKLFSPVIPVPELGVVVLVLGSFNECMQAWDVGQGTMLWENPNGEHNFRPGRGWTDRGWIESGGKVYFNKGTSSELTLPTLDMTTGTLTSLVSEPDFEFVPLAVRDDCLLAQAKNTRGTSRVELWCISTDDGERIWAHRPEGTDVVHSSSMSFGSSGAWTAIPGEDYVYVLQQLPGVDVIRFEALDPKSGEVVLSSDTEFEGSWSGFAPTRDLIYVTLWGSVFVLDVKTGVIVREWL